MGTGGVSGLGRGGAMKTGLVMHHIFAAFRFETRLAGGRKRSLEDAVILGQVEALRLSTLS